MKGTLALNVVFQLLICMIIANVSTVKTLTAEETCLLVRNNTYIGNPNDCQGWVHCVNGKPIYGKCRGNLLYDSANGACDYPYNVDCNMNEDTMCSGLSDVYKSHPSDCNKYCYCFNEVAHCDKCPLGKVYDPKTISCKWAGISKCEKKSPCIIAPNGYIGDGKTCTGYHHCQNSREIHSGHCGGGLYYNPMTGMCDNPHNVKCSLNSSPTPPISSAPMPPLDVCKNGKSFYPDEISCRGYFYCRNTNDTSPAWGQCSKNMYFSYETQNCRDQKSVNCTKSNV